MTTDIFKELAHAFDGGTIKDCCITDEMAIIEHYGLKNQVKKLNEEAYELCEAEHVFLTSKANGATDSMRMSLENITSEMADCLVLIEQLRQYHKISGEVLKKEYDYKIARQLARIVNERKEQ